MSFLRSVAYATSVLCEKSERIKKIERDHHAAPIALQNQNHNFGFQAQRLADELVFREAFLGIADLNRFLSADVVLPESPQDLIGSK